MNRQEANMLLTAIAIGDNRTTDDDAVEYWRALLADTRLEDAMQALATHRRESTEWIQPAHIRRLVKAERARRIDAANIVYEPIGEENARQFLDRVAAVYRAAGDGRMDPRRIGLALEPGPNAAAAPAEIEAVTEGRKAVRSALNVRCPFCKAGPRSPCKVGKNANGKPGFVHPTRIDASRADATTTNPEGSQ
jgi:hypothetical protein